MIGKIKQRAEIGVLTAALVIPLGLCVVAFLGVSLYFTLRESLPPNLSALVTAASGIVLIAVTVIIGKLSNIRLNRSRRSQPKVSEGLELADELESYLRDHADPVLTDWIRDNPDRAALITLALGVGAGYSSQFRRVLMDAYARYAESESARRSNS